MPHIVINDNGHWYECVPDSQQAHLTSSVDNRKEISPEQFIQRLGYVDIFNNNLNIKSLTRQLKTFTSFFLFIDYNIAISTRKINFFGYIESMWGTCFKIIKERNLDGIWQGLCRVIFNSELYLKRYFFMNNLS